MAEFNLGLALQGFGEGFQGRGAQFSKGLQQRSDRQQKLSTERIQAAANDALSIRNLIGQGRPDIAIEFMQNRIQAGGQLGGDMGESQNLLNLLSNAQSSEDLQSIATELDDDILKFQAAGVLQAPQDEILAASNVTPQGQVITQAPGGQVTASDVPGFKTKAETKDAQPQINFLRSSIKDNLKDFKKVSDAHKRVMAVGSNATAASDLALIFNFMKMLDPGSVVRESEFRTAAAARAWMSRMSEGGISVPGAVVQGIQKLETGASLLPEQRTDFLNQVDDLFGAAELSADTNIENVLQQADQDQIKRERVFGTKRLSDFDERQRLRKSSGGTRLKFDAQGNPIQ